MKIKKQYGIAIIVIAVIAFILIALQIVKTSVIRNDYTSQIVSLSPSGGPPETIDGLRNAIALYEKQIEAHVRDAAQTASYWKILAIRYQDRNLHNLALDALERAIFYNPSDPLLYYSTGVSAGYVAKHYIEFFSRDSNQERERLYALSESAYLSAIKLDSTYTRPLYGIGVLYVFELNRSADAIPYLERYLELSANDTDAMFVLARAYYNTNAFQKAIDLYDRIIVVAKEDNKKREAWNNKQQVMEILYG
ncbi:MAG: tetratricopeptide repeat protein [Treponema sp.]|jgi:tetratricopeptide (TPR) repeat protein|nr:tetratricopeptide repeat protein [Treponema sp.]